MDNTQKPQSGDAAGKTDNAKTGNADKNNIENKSGANQANIASAKPQNQTQNASQEGKSGTEPKQADSQLANQVGNVVRGDTGAIKNVLNQAKESTGEVASQAYGIAAKKATSAIDEQKTNLAQGLTSVADSIREIGGSLRGSGQAKGVADVAAKYGDSIADQVERFSSSLDKKDLRELMRDVEHFAHKNPAVFLGGAFALGILAARFLKSGNPEQALMRRPRSDRRDLYIPGERQDNRQSENLDRQAAGLSDNRKDFRNDISSAGDSTSANTFSPKKGD